MKATSANGLRTARALGWIMTAACVPPGSSPLPDGGGRESFSMPSAPPVRPSVNVMTAPFEDDFQRTATVDASAGFDGALDLLGPDWVQTAAPNAGGWRIEKGRLCTQGAHNHGVWLTRTLPIRARIEFDAVSYSADGDLKAEVWGDGRSAATAISYTNATSYLTIFGGWKNKLHVLARINEHGTDRKEVAVDPTSDDPRQRPVNPGQIYHFRIERTDGKTVRWSVDGVELLSFVDPAPLTGFGHDHFGFNNWEAKVCYDNVKVTPL